MPWATQYNAIQYNTIQYKFSENIKYSLNVKSCNIYVPEVQNVHVNESKKNLLF